jgi:hypothetical protein
MSELSERLRAWAQNGEMVDSGYTAHGRDCIDAADAIDRLRRGPDIADDVRDLFRDELMYARAVIECLSEKAHHRADREYCMRVLKDGNSIDRALNGFAPSSATQAIQAALAAYYLSDAPFVGDRMRAALEGAGFRLRGYGPSVQEKESSATSSQVTTAAASPALVCSACQKTFAGPGFCCEREECPHAANRKWPPMWPATEAER